ncbi:hypothetical protein PSACC_02131 [Paramicrosporidium saccamoebae]|uniref:SAM-dependent MTase RsmB/NOP-type domain-containing protein n=1 Tax=Paramicrosporidium saccamoebae TaxID=1246581 RepID=A0A2H9TJZ4_9FUNG|nr:hypothetical protein PSACC_02131 [Paramicrosporidium saccamoebae]
MTEQVAESAPVMESAPKKSRTDGYVHYDDIKRENAVLEDYYRRQEIIPDEEWPQFLAVLGQNLPITFRLTGHRDEAASINRQLHDVLLPTLGTAARSLPWYPEGYAFHLDTDRKSMRTQEGYSAFHKWLVAATENGDISRQEAVSMVPPLLMDIKAEHLVLDMCAAPGSKTAQLVEYMHADAQKMDVEATGLVIANDSDQQRAYLLYHQVKRILSPGLLVANNDGTSFPTLVAAANGNFERVYFDRILADVPCSGDGTLRKNANLWKTWTPHLALGLHPLQIRLLDKAVRLLKVGGRLVYSTCSMNPVENEAVLAYILHQYSHALHLVDVSSDLAGLERRPGKSGWKVLTKDGAEYEKAEDVPQDQRKRFPPSLFPKPEYSQLNLDRCLRIYPHLQNTGAFFVAVIAKTADIDTVAAEPSANSAPRPVKKGKRKFGVPKTESEFRILDPSNDPVLDNIFDWFGIDKERLIQNGYGFLVRSERDPIKVVSLVSPCAMPIFKATVSSHRVEGEQELYNGSLKIVNAGVRAFEVYESNRPVPVDCPYRLLSESVAILRPYMNKRVVKVEKEVILQLIDCQDSVKIEIEGLDQGGAVLEATNTEGNMVCIPVWISERGIKAFVPNPNRPALRLQLA